MKIRILFSCVLFLTISNVALASKCEEVRMGLDVGSGSTKMMVAKVDFCKKKILEVLHRDARQVSFNEDLAKSTDSKLSPAIVDEGLVKITELLESGKKFKPTKTFGVATSVFRKAANGQDIIKSYARKLKMRLEVISHHEEAVLGYISANSMLDENLKKDKNVVAWDIGGGSMQILYLNEKLEPETYLGDLASVTFKNMVVEALMLKDPETHTSPNPLAQVSKMAVGLSRSYAKIHVPSEMKKVLKESIVIGVGGVHGISIKNQIGQNKIYTLEELKKTASKRVLLSDKELVGDYKTTDVTNLLLVQGFMEALEINQVNIVEANLIEGLLLK